MKTIRVNGETRQTDENNLNHLVRSMQADTSGLVVEYNSRIIREAEWANIQLSDDDVIEMLRFVGGG